MLNSRRNKRFKIGLETYGQWFNPSLRIVDGAITVPNGPGVGLADPNQILKDAILIQESAAR